MLVSSVERTDPNIAKGHWAPVSCERDWATADLVSVVRQDLVAGGAVDLLVAMHEDAIVEHGHIAWRLEIAVFKDGGGEDNVVGLPLTRWAGDVDERRCLGINGGALAVWIKRFVKGIEDLNFVETVKKHAIVALVIPRTIKVRGHHPLQVKLEISESLFGPGGLLAACD